MWCLQEQSTRVGAAASTADPEQQLVAAAAADREQKPVAALPAAAAAAAAAEGGGRKRRQDQETGAAYRAEEAEEQPEWIRRWEQPFSGLAYDGSIASSTSSGSSTTSGTRSSDSSGVEVVKRIRRRQGKDAQEVKSCSTACWVTLWRRGRRWWWLGAVQAGAATRASRRGASRGRLLERHRCVPWAVAGEDGGVGS